MFQPLDDQYPEVQSFNPHETGSSQRVLATSVAEAAAHHMAALLSGPLIEKLWQIDALGTRLSNPSVWDGELARRFRTVQWPAQRRALSNARRTLEAVSKHADSVLEDILHAGGSGRAESMADDHNYSEPI